MFWSLSYKLMPNETTIGDSTKKTVSGLRPTYAVFLANQWAIFRFEGAGSSMSQSFTYQEIADARPVRRLLIHYLHLRTPAKEHFLHTPNPEYWSSKILEVKKSLVAISQGLSSPVRSPLSAEHGRNWAICSSC